MTKKFLILFLFFLLFSPCFLPPDYCLFSLTSDQTTPIWWEIKILLITEGEYRLEQKKTSYLGNYTFTILWTGSMERDDSDYILYHQESRLLDWKAKEKEILSEFIKTKSGKDFQKKPSFHLNYILRKEENLHFDFFVKGLCIPQNKSVSKFYLHLPCTGDNKEPHPDIDYDSYVIQGSNQIFLEEKEIYTGAVDRDFAWIWKYYKWSSTQETPAFLTSLHKAKVKISITPHFKKN